MCIFMRVSPLLARSARLPEILPDVARSCNLLDPLARYTR